MDDSAEKLSLRGTCCDGSCCTGSSSPYVMPHERDRIVEATGRDEFRKEGNHFLIKTDTKRNCCPFLTDNRLCSLQQQDPKLKPADCYMHPLWLVEEGDKLAGYKSDCCAFVCSPEFQKEVEAIFATIPKEHRRGIFEHQTSCGFPLEEVDLE